MCGDGSVDGRGRGEGAGWWAASGGHCSGTCGGRGGGLQQLLLPRLYVHPLRQASAQREKVQGKMASPCVSCVQFSF